MTLIIVSNRLPFSLNKNGEIKQSSGGLVSAISGISDDIPKKWVGISPDKVTPRKWKKLELENKRIYKPVFIDPKLYKKYYNGISNDVLWPIFHYELSLNFDWENWEAYEKVNQLIAEKINEVSKPEDIIWIHDFHLFLVPQFLRKLGNKNKIGFFLHIPFPSSELFRQIPTRKEILQGVLESDLIGFHDYAYLKHFCNSVKAILGVSSNMLNMKYNNREVNLGVFPVSIDTKKFIEASESNEVKQIFEEIKATKNY
jgi:trehalose 6-phosphate synthase/phosphatase